MAKASSAEQLRLLDLQALDSNIRKLRNRARSVSDNSAIADLGVQRAAAQSMLVAASTEAADVARELTRAEADVASVVARIERNQNHLDSGKGSSKELTALQSEMELEVMERLEAAKIAEEQFRTAASALDAEVAVLEEARDAELAEIEAERVAAVAERAELAATFDPDLLAVYEKTLAKNGIGAARLFNGTSEGSGMQLSPGDLADIRRAAEDDIVFCPDSGCILVRSAEWGS